MTAPINLYDQQRRNKNRTWMILFGFVAFLAFLGMGADAFLYGSGVGPGIPVATLGALCLGGFSAWWALAGGDKAVLESTHAVPVDTRDPKQRVLDNVVEEMAIAAGVPKPAVYIIPDSDPNAFATGTGPEKSSVAVTAGLVQSLSREELQGVVAHELSHVRNYDIRFNLLVGVLVGAAIAVGLLLVVRAERVGRVAQP